MKLIAQSKKLWDKYAAKNERSMAEVALIVDPQSAVYVNETNKKCKKIFVDMRTKLNRLGAPFEVYSFNDIGKADNALVDALKKAVAHENAEVITICAQVEEEIAELSPEEKQAFIEELGIGESGLDKLVKACYKLLGLISYLTAGPKEVRAWTIERGTKAPQAAGKIHTDFERGFIRAEVVPFETLKELGSMTACKEKGLIRSEGKDYVMQDGDVVVFRFNV